VTRYVNLKQAIKHKGLTWSLSTAWNVQGRPAICVLDEKGVIRYRNVRGGAMDNAVYALFAKLEGK